MFDNLTDKLTGIFSRLTSKGRLTEKDIDEALGMVRRSLLEADVNFRVARDFVAAVKERSMGSDVLESLTPGQQVVKIVHEELTSLLSGGDHRLTPSSQATTALMLVGLQGSGKTTTTAKIALRLGKRNKKKDTSKAKMGMSGLKRYCANLYDATLNRIANTTAPPNILQRVRG